MSETVSVSRRAIFGRLRRFQPRSSEADAPKLLLVAPLSGLPATALHDMIVGLAGQHRVHLLEWADAADVAVAEGDFGLGDQVSEIRAAIRRLGRRLHVIGLCQSALPTLAATSLVAAAGGPPPCSITLVGGKLDPRIRPTRADVFARDHPLDWFRRRVLVTVGASRCGYGRLVYSGLAQRTAFLAYLGRHYASGGELLAKSLNDDGIDPLQHPFLPSLLSPVDVPAEFFLETISDVFQKFLFARGLMRWRGEIVAPESIETTALLTIEGEFDDISAPGQTRIAHDLCRRIPGDRRDHCLQSGVGHFGLFHGRVWREFILQRMQDFVRRHAG